MTQTYVAPTADDIVDTVDTPSERLSRQADTFFADAEARAFRPTTSVRQAVREDLGESRAWVRARAEQSRQAIVQEPVRATLYAVGAGLLIGLLLRR